ncbi:MAG: exosortase T [Deltaproteobacteria bacterium]|nr:exosortase T [Deltaproteobacteria bacterium]MBK9369077.1 exosortase T [Deltaproteobacteria bacterium]
MTRLATLLLIPGLVALAAEPALWLVEQWRRPIDGSAGVLAALAALGLAVRAARSGPDPSPGAEARLAWGLVALAAASRLLGRVLAVNHLGGAALCLDVMAIALGLGLHRRPVPASPLGLAALFAMSLPLEYWVQRAAGHPMRLAAAAAAEALLSPFVSDLTRRGAMLSRPGVQIAVELPCSGSQGLTLLLTLAMFLGVTRRGVGPLIALAAVGALSTNALRVALFVLRPDWLAEPAHSVVGLVTLALGAAPTLWLAQRLPTLTPAPPRAAPPWACPPAVAAACSVAAVLITLAPQRPVDLSVASPGASLPASLGARHGVPRPLSPEETSYLERFGGHVEKRLYDGDGDRPSLVLLLRTTAPLRHLHEPSVCLRAAGNTVEYLGVRHDLSPTVTWRATSPEGAVYRVQASFFSERGEWASSGAEAAWRWLAAPGTSWAMLQRITPWALCEDDPTPCLSLERELAQALDLPPPPHNSSQTIDLPQPLASNP